MENKEKEKKEIVFDEKDLDLEFLNDNEPKTQKETNKQFEELLKTKQLIDMLKDENNKTKLHPIVLMALSKQNNNVQTLEDLIGRLLDQNLELYRFNVEIIDRLLVKEEKENAIRRQEKENMLLRVDSIFNTLGNFLGATLADFLLKDKKENIK